MPEVASLAPRVAQAALEAMARTLSPEDLGALSFNATIRHGALVLPSNAAAIPATRAPLALATLPDADADALPRVSLASSPGGAHQTDLALLRPLGEGGMGVVWLAHQRSLHRDVAVKRLKTAKSPDGASTGSSALLAEGRATGALEHPNIVPVHALGLDAEGSPILVMKRIEGDSLEALIRDPRHASWPDLERRHGDRQAAYVQVLMQVADALEFAHARGIIHRDVKPENVMVGHFGEVYLVDWGVALRRDKGDPDEPPCIVGTPSFMAPEMARGDARAVDAQTDVYLLGATLHATLVGSPRHAGESLFNVLMAAMTSEPFTYEAQHGELGELANRATDPDKAKRPASALAFRAALAAYLRHRASMRLADEAHARLAAVSGSPEPTRALTESRFGFTQALRDWPDNLRAREGLEQTLRLMIEAELHRRSPDAAQALLGELSVVDPELKKRIEAMREEMAQGRALEARARTEAMETDPVQTARQRVWVSLGLIALTVVLVSSARASEASSTAPRTMSEVLVYDSALVVTVAFLVALFRKRLLVNRMGRQITLALVGVVVAATLSDALFWLRGAHAHDAGPSSMLVMASVLGGAAIGIDRRFFVSAAAFLAGAIVCAIWPDLTVLAIGGASILALLVVLFDSLGQAFRKAPSP